MKIPVHLIIGISFLVFGCSKDSGDTTIPPVGPEPEVEGLYFPPLDADTWETTSIAELGWNMEAEQPLLDFLEAKNTKAFLLLKDGKIVIEAYMNGSGASSNNAWNSAGKTLSAFIVGLAQQEGFLSLDDSSANYLGSGWSSLSENEEAKITIKHHISMTTGLDYNVANQNCTDANCLTFLNDPGSFWYYHNAPYTLNHAIVAGAIDGDYDSYFDTKLKQAIGMNGAWVQLGYARVYYSTARSMARFGLLNLNMGTWDNNQILADTAYFNEMVNTSQDLNKSYGYLWWLNGKESYRSPGLELQFPGKLIPNAPDDLIAGLGKDDQKLHIVPSKGLVIVRMGDDAGEALLGPSSFDNELWEKINALIN
ncbi:serine hydrolase [Flavobacteriaceae bacterium TP-CH-4]|uniref:Serine hydrolase n=1 Tax=Pelagihabitans pacificus TaxID=2696054 RepID=A0A967AUZ3_9FLAO|nr:serine hydrolase domain-containing protein [Pelagihabitans pacificus]NHF58062.1 serine hydrolase [Pelagihabitans pacificus]